MRYAFADEAGATVFVYWSRKSLRAARSFAVKRFRRNRRFFEVVVAVKDTRTGKLFPLSQKEE
jgi:hypothetical protein